MCCNMSARQVGSRNEEELNRLLTSTVMVRRRKAEVLADLPPKMRKQVLLLLPADKRRELDRLRTRLGEVRKLAADMHGVGAAIGGGLLAGIGHYALPGMVWCGVLCVLPTTCSTPSSPVCIPS